MMKSANALLVAIAALAAVTSGLGARYVWADEYSDKPQLEDRRVCACDGIRAGDVGWCERHWRGYAYGHVLRTTALYNALLSAEEDPNLPVCGACGYHVPASHDDVYAEARHDHAGPPSPPFLTETSTLAMVHALQTCSVHSTLLVHDIPGYCPVCRRSYVKGRTARSWVFAALEVGKPLPGVTKATADKTANAAAPTTQPADEKRETPGVRSVDPNAPPEAQGHDEAPVPGCEACKRAFAAGAVLTSDGFPAQPFCEKCGVGVVAGRVFTGREAYELARAADAGLAYHRLNRCELCAVGILTGQRCNICGQCRKCHAVGD